MGIECVVQRARNRILRYLEKRRVITIAAASCDGEVNADLGEGFDESNPALTTLLSAATSGSSPAGPPEKRAPVLMLLEADSGLAPKALLSHMVVLVPPPKRHVTVHSGGLRIAGGAA